MQIFFDLDGTLIDSTWRLYNLFQHLVPKSEFTYQQYWEQKKKQIDHKTILSSIFSFEQSEIKEFQKNWMLLIEEDSWLAYDQPIAGVTECLLQLNKNNVLYIVTNRQFRAPVLKQLEQFGWSHFLKKVFVTGQLQDKVDLIKSEVDTSNEDWMIGDTGMDILHGRKLGLKTAAVLSGFSSHDVLLKYSPDIIIESVKSLPFAIENFTSQIICPS